MSEYTPTTEDVREAYSGGRSGEYHAVTGPEFDRWLAAHDAEVRKSVDPEMAMPCADTKPHAAHVWQMSATGFCLCAGVVTEEPEWEYGATGFDPTQAASLRESLDAAEDAQRYWVDVIGAPSVVMKRTPGRKPGPWVAVKQEGVDDV